MPADEQDDPRGAVQPRGNRGALNDHSGVTADAATHEVVPANGGRQYLLIQNNHATLDLWIDFGIAAVLSYPSIQVYPGSTLIWGDGGGFIPTQAVNMIASAAGVTYTIKEG